MDDTNKPAEEVKQETTETPVAQTPVVEEKAVDRTKNRRGCSSWRNSIEAPAEPAEEVKEIKTPDKSRRKSKLKKKKGK